MKKKAVRNPRKIPTRLLRSCDFFSDVITAMFFACPDSLVIFLSRGRSGGFEGFGLSKGLAVLNHFVIMCVVLCGFITQDVTFSSKSRYLLNFQLPEASLKVK